MRVVLASAAAAAMAGIVSAGHHAAGHRQAHELFARKMTKMGCEAQCSTVVKTFYGEPTLYNPRVDAPSETETEAEYAEATEKPVEPYVKSVVSDKKEVADAAPAVPETPAVPEEEESAYQAPAGLWDHGGSDHWAIAYTPFKEGGGCRPRDEVYSDVQKIKAMGFNTLRIYSTECDTLKNVGDACAEHGLRLIAGVFVKDKGCGYSGQNKAQVDDLVKWGRWDLVSAVIIGNEAVFGGLCSAPQLRGLIEGAKADLQAAKFPGPYMTAETVNIWEKHGGELCGSVDVPGANIHAYFDQGVAPAQAGKFVQSQLATVASICGKKALTTESGWPTEGKVNGKAVPGYNQQMEAVESIRNTCGSDVVFFAYGKAFWKGDSDCGCEPYFNVDASF